MVPSLRWSLPALGANFLRLTLPTLLTRGLRSPLHANPPPQKLGVELVINLGKIVTMEKNESRVFVELKPLPEDALDESIFTYALRYHKRDHTHTHLHDGVNENRVRVFEQRVSRRVFPEKTLEDDEARNDLGRSAA